MLDVGSLYSQVDVYSEMLRNAPAFPLSGLACFLSGDLASQDLKVRKISRGGLQHPLHCVFGDAVNCPGAPLVWPCVLPQWRPCVTGLGVRKISRGGLQHPLRMASLETLL